MKSMTRSALVAATIFVAAVFSNPAAAVTPEDVAARYQAEYQIVSVSVSATDPAVYEMVVRDAEVGTLTILVDVATGDIIPAEEPETPPAPETPPPEVAATDPATRDECRNDGWTGFGFRNQGQCIRFVNTGFDSRDAGAGSDDDDSAGESADEAAAEEERRGEACRDGAWEALGFRNQGQCIGDLGG